MLLVTTFERTTSYAIFTTPEPRLQQARDRPNPLSKRDKSWAGCAVARLRQALWNNTDVDGPDMQIPDSVRPEKLALGERHRTTVNIVWHTLQ